MGWDGMGWDGMGWDGMGWDGWCRGLEHSKCPWWDSKPTLSTGGHELGGETALLNIVCHPSRRYGCYPTTPPPCSAFTEGTAFPAIFEAPGFTLLFSIFLEPRQPGPGRSQGLSPTTPHRANVPAPARSPAAPHHHIRSQFLEAGMRPSPFRRCPDRTAPPASTRTRSPGSLLLSPQPLLTSHLVFSASEESISLR